MKINPAYKLLVVSTSTIYGSEFLEYIKHDFVEFIQSDELLFIPFARPSGISFDAYTAKVQEALTDRGVTVTGLHQFPNMKKAIQDAKAIFIGGGNTFLLLKTLYELDLVQQLRLQVAKGIPYVGTSAGSNLTGLTIGTTNDMPIVYPPSFDALGFLPFNINPHYLDPYPKSTHRGETRETRIKEFHQLNTQPVIGLREGSWLHVNDGKIQLQGNLAALLFRPGLEPVELAPGLINF
ncbi:dipeptidase PepE [Sphingobacterium sp. 2149]|uniref:dipeptidase PepE n=1 Tax=Sphingobacterium sp. 2149 TaxID=2817763 RepID=UPI001AE24B7D|nr:dipeptidase PepE [Sphingobacterium sp. 2149]MDR6736043.1 dipeptidase E [Sphingobacterium sp. 2149]